MSWIDMCGKVKRSLAVKTGGYPFLWSFRLEQCGAERSIVERRNLIICNFPF